MSARKVLIGLVLLLTPAVVRAAAKPNVILISLDAVAASHMDLFGYGRATMPTLREFARENVNFENDYAQAAFTLPSHYSMFTGVNPYVHKVIDMSVQPSHSNPASLMLDPGILTLTEYLKRAGYGTFSSAPLWGAQLNFTRGLSRGFDTLEDALVDETFRPRDKKRLARLLKSAAAKPPAFLFLYSWGGHDPYRPAPPDDGRFGKKRKKKKIQTEAEVYEMLRELRAHGNQAVGGVDPERERYFGQFDLSNEADVEQLRSLYDGGLRTLDTRLKLLFAMLKRAGLYDDSLIIVTADHGESFGEHGLFRHSTPYENEIHVPLIMKIPGTSGVVVHSPVREIDLLPTVLDLLGLEGGANIEGESLVPLLKKELPRPAKYYSIGFTSFCYRDGDWKLISWRDHEELFNVAEDPEEKRDLAPQNAKKVLELEAKLVAMRASHSGTR